MVVYYGFGHIHISLRYKTRFCIPFALAGGKISVFQTVRINKKGCLRILYRSGVWSGIFSKSGAFGGLFGTLAEEKKSWYLSVCQDKIFLFQTGFFKINEIKKDTIKVVNISDITKFTINNKTTYLSEKQLKKDTLVLSLESGTNSFLATIYHDYQFCINNIIYKILYKSKTE